MAVNQHSRVVQPAQFRINLPGRPGPHKNASDQDVENTRPRFDDIPEATRTTPPLSGVRQPIQQMGSAAVKLLITANP